MSNVYEKIDAIFANELNESRPSWVDEILIELREIRNSTKSIDKIFLEFVNWLRETMKADTQKEVYPKIKYNDMTLGINFKGLLYNTKNNKVLSFEDAQKTYKFFYSNKNNLTIFN